MSVPETISNETWLRALEAQVERVRDAGSASAVHQMRVAAGRLSVWLELGGRVALRDDLRWLRRTAMSVRDADVMLAAPRPDRWHAALLEARAASLVGLRRELSTSRPRAIAIGLAFVPGPNAEQARSRLGRLARRTLRAGDDIAGDERDAAQFHRLRRRVRRTRYALEWLGMEATRVKDLQDALGRLNDSSVELAHMAALPDGARQAPELAALEVAREQLRLTALAQWSSCRTELRQLARMCAA